MDTIIIICIGAAICWYFYKQKKQRALPPAETKIETKKVFTPSPKVERTFEEQYGVLPCAGAKCNPHNHCDNDERLFCRDVISKIKGLKSFKGQFSVSLPSGVRRVDFALETMDKRYIAVEVDGYKTHSQNMTKNDFNDQQLRQNELKIAGWEILRFSVNQIRQEAGKCIKIIESLISQNSKQEVNLKTLVYAVLNVPFKSKDTVKKLGATWSEPKSTWYLANPDEDKLNKFAEWNPVMKAQCLIQGCPGELTRILRKDKAAFYWSCSECNNTFSDENYRPKPKTPRCLNPKCSGFLNEMTGKYGLFWKCQKCHTTFDYKKITV